MSSVTVVDSVSSGSERTDRAVERTAVRFVRAWGFTTVEMVAARFRMLERAVAPRVSLARRALAALPDVAWLDPTREWFTLVARESSMRISIEKIVGVRPLVGLFELEEALGKRHSFGAAPAVVVRAYVGVLAEDVRRRDARARLSEEEHVVLEAFEATGGLATLEELRAATHARLPPGALVRLLQTSPLFLRASRGRYAVVGAAHGAAVPALLPSRASTWQAVP